LKQEPAASTAERHRYVNPLGGADAVLKEGLLLREKEDISRPAHLDLNLTILEQIIQKRAKAEAMFSEAQTVQVSKNT
jgi:hypothetical protein